MTKEEILWLKPQVNFGNINDTPQLYIQKIFAAEAMDEYAEQVAKERSIAFGIWINKNYLWRDATGFWLQSENPKWVQKTDTELYELFLKSTQTVNHG